MNVDDIKKYLSQKIEKYSETILNGYHTLGDKDFLIDDIKAYRHCVDVLKSYRDLLAWINISEINEAKK